MLSSRGGMVRYSINLSHSVDWSLCERWIESLLGTGIWSQLYLINNLDPLMNLKLATSKYKYLQHDNSVPSSVCLF